METVSFPGISESIDRALHDLLSGYFDTGGEFTLGASPVQVTAARLLYKTGFLRQPGTTPEIIILPTQHFAGADQKVPGVQSLEPGYEHRIAVTRTVFTRVPVSAVNSRSLPEAQRVACRLWDQLFAVIATQRHDFALRGILVPVLDAVPAEHATDEEDSTSAVYFGNFRFIACARHIRNASETVTEDDEVQE